MESLLIDRFLDGLAHLSDEANTVLVIGALAGLTIAAMLSGLKWRTSLCMLVTLPAGFAFLALAVKLFAASLGLIFNIAGLVLLGFAIVLLGIAAVGYLAADAVGRLAQAAEEQDASFSDKPDRIEPSLRAAVEGEA